jgi:uncharacterized membrane protein YgcG
VLFVAGTAANIATAATSHFGLVPVPVALAGLVLIGCARRMPVRTAKGTDRARTLLGFRSYLAAAAGLDRPPGQDVLDTYLPYAIVLGCTEQWADLTAAVSDPSWEPSWYRGAELSSLSHPAAWVWSVHQFATSTSIMVTSTSARTSAGGGSGGSSGSGFSGGFSGGGGGGGGGGSW